MSGTTPLRHDLFGRTLRAVLRLAAYAIFSAFVLTYIGAPRLRGEASAL
jgi:hypothetical protein